MGLRAFIFTSLI